MEISIYFIFNTIKINVTGQHDRQDERLIRQLPNQPGHCSLTRHYFDSCEPPVSLTKEKNHLSHVFNRLKIQHHISIIIIISQIT